MRETIITSKKSWKYFFTEIWDYREVLFFLGWRDILVHYKQTVIGIGWVVLRPLLMVVIFTVIFAWIAKIESPEVPYPLVVFSGMIAWQFFADVVTFGSHSFLANQQLVSKVYFPRIILPASRVLCSLIDSFILLVVYLLLSRFRYGITPSLSFFLLPLFLIWLAFFSLTISLLFAALIMQYRDFRHIVPFVVQVSLYCTTVAFSIWLVPQNLQWVLALNPLVGIINGLRFCLFNESFSISTVFISCGVTGLCAVLSFFYFQRVQDTFADIL